MNHDPHTKPTAPAGTPSQSVRDTTGSPSTKDGAALLPALNDLVRRTINQIAEGTRRLAECDLPPDLAQLLAGIDDSTRTLSQVMTLVMDQWMLDVGSIRPDAIDFDLRTTLAEARGSVTRMARESENDLDTLFDPAIPSPLQGDPSRLRQIILALAGYLTSRVRGDIIQWQCSREAEDDHQVTLRVSFATTPGRIDHELVRQAFEVGGLGVDANGLLLDSGLGPYHARQLARILGGDAGCEHNADRTLLWARVVLQKRGAEGASPPAKSGQRVLFVSSSPKEIRTVVAALHECGWDARGARTQEEALAILGESAGTGQPYDYIVVTLLLPDGSGERLAQEAFSILGRERVHVVLLADLGRPGDAEWARMLGCSAYIVRPLKTKTLDGVLSELRGHTQRRAGDTRGVFVTRHSIAERNERSLWVLVVDDDPVTRQSITSIVQGLGHQAYAAENATAALELCDRAMFDLILIDIRMPDLDGDQLALLVRSRERTSGRRPAAIFGITSQPGADDRQRCLASGMNDLLPKPIGVETIRRIADFMRPDEALLYVWQPAATPRQDTETPDPGEPVSKPTLAHDLGLVPDAPAQPPDDIDSAAAA